MHLSAKKLITVLTFSMFGGIIGIIAPSAHAGVLQGSSAVVNGHYACDCTAPTAICGCVVS
jgi:hypothetical protein